MATCNVCNGTKVCQGCKGRNQRCGCGVWDSFAGVLRGNKAGKCTACNGTGQV